MEKLASIPFHFRFLAELVIIAAICCTYYFVFYTPLEEKLEQLGREYDDVVYGINDIKPVTLSYDKYKQQLALMEEQYAVVIKALPDDKGFYLLYDETVGLAEKDGVKVSLFQPGGESRLDNFHSSVSFNIRMEAPYSNFVKYLYDLNYLDKIINLQKMTINLAPARSGERMLDIQATFNSYRFGASSPATTGRRR